MKPLFRVLPIVYVAMALDPLCMPPYGPQACLHVCNDIAVVKNPVHPKRYGCCDQAGDCYCCIHFGICGHVNSKYHCSSCERIRIETSCSTCSGPFPGSNIYHSEGQHNKLGSPNLEQTSPAPSQPFQQQFPVNPQQNLMRNQHQNQFPMTNQQQNQFPLPSQQQNQFPMPNQQQNQLPIQNQQFQRQTLPNPEVPSRGLNPKSHHHQRIIPNNQNAGTQNIEGQQQTTLNPNLSGQRPRGDQGLRSLGSNRNVQKLPNDGLFRNPLNPMVSDPQRKHPHKGHRKISHRNHLKIEQFGTHLSTHQSNARPKPSSIDSNRLQLPPNQQPTQSAGLQHGPQSFQNLDSQQGQQQQQVPTQQGQQQNQIQQALLQQAPNQQKSPQFATDPSTSQQQTPMQPLQQNPQMQHPQQQTPLQQSQQGPQMQQAPQLQQSLQVQQSHQPPHRQQSERVPQIQQSQQTPQMQQSQPAPQMQQTRLAPQIQQSQQPLQIQESQQPPQMQQAPQIQQSPPPPQTQQSPPPPQTQQSQLHPQMQQSQLPPQMQQSHPPQMQQSPQTPQMQPSQQPTQSQQSQQPTQQQDPVHQVPVQHPQNQPPNRPHLYQAPIQQAHQQNTVQQTPQYAPAQQQVPTQQASTNVGQRSPLQQGSQQATQIQPKSLQRHNQQVSPPNSQKIPHSSTDASQPSVRELPTQQSTQLPHSSRRELPQPIPTSSTASANTISDTPQPPRGNPGALPPSQFNGQSNAAQNVNQQKPWGGSSQPLQAPQQSHLSGNGPSQQTQSYPNDSEQFQAHSSAQTPRDNFQHDIPERPASASTPNHLPSQDQSDNKYLYDHDTQTSGPYHSEAALPSHDISLQTPPSSKEANGHTSEAQDSKLVSSSTDQQLHGLDHSSITDPNDHQQEHHEESQHPVDSLEAKQTNEILGGYDLPEDSDHHELPQNIDHSGNSNQPNGPSFH